MSEAPKQADTTTDFIAEAVPAGKYLVNPYEDWAVAEGVPIATGRAIDLMALETRPWARFGCNGAIAHVDGRCDFLTVFVHEIAPGKAAAPQRHVYDELCVVLSGDGETEIEITGSGNRVVAWGPGTLLAPPSNARYRHRNTGSSPARLAALNDLRYLMGLYRSERFVFENDGAPGGVRPFGSDTALDLSYSRTADTSTGRRGTPRGSDTVLIGSGTIGADVVEVAAGTGPSAQVVRPGGSDTVLPARRQMQGAHLLGLGGEGITRSWREGREADATETRWRHGVVIGLHGMHFHRHVNAGLEEARALDVQLGSALYPMSRSRRHHYGDTSVYASGSAEIA